MQIKSTIRKFDHIILFVALIALIALPIVVENAVNSPVFRQLINVMIITAGVSMTFSHAAISNRWSLYFGQFLFLISLIDVFWNFDGGIARALSLFQVMYFAVLMGKVFTLILRVKEVDAKMLMYALSGYILLGLIWGVLVSVWLAIHPGSFSFESGIGSGIENENYFAFVTMTTLGYGDLLPVTGAAKAFSTLIAITGAFYMTIVMGIIVGKYVSVVSNKEIKK